MNPSHVWLVIAQEFRIRLRTGRWRWLLGAWLVLLLLFTLLLDLGLHTGFTYIPDNSLRGVPLFGFLMFFVLGSMLVISPALTAQTVNGAELASLEISIGGSTQLASDFDVSNGKIDGNAASKVTGYEISNDGILSLKYSNGELTPKYRIAMASVQSPDNLKPLPGNVYSQSNESGVIVMGYAGTNGYGSIISGALEDSNVDIAEELTSMIESQRNYTANSKVFQTGSELMEVLVNLKR